MEGRGALGGRDVNVNAGQQGFLAAGKRRVGEAHAHRRGGRGLVVRVGGGRLLLLALNVMAAVLKELLLGHQVARQGVALLQVTRVAAKNR
jgi:hypothetical protein